MAPIIQNVEALFPEKTMPLWGPAPYKVVEGGRGGSKSWSFVRILLILGMRRKLFILCAREFQKSIDESVHKLIADQIVLMNLHEHIDSATGKTIAAKYEVQKTSIVGSNGTRFVFAGLRNHVQAIKSMEGIDICVVFEATFVSQWSWEVLLPTIRRDPPFGPFGQGSEIWVEFNPELTSDYTYQYWVVNPPEGTVHITMNYRDNPWFPETLRRQMKAMRLKDPDGARTVWDGKTRRVLQGAIYAKEMEAAIKDDRVSPRVRYDRSRGVIVSFDLGRADMTSLWFIQQAGTEHYVVDHYSNCGFDFSHYLEEMQNRKYVYKLLLLPHDAVQAHISAKASVKKQAEDAYPGKVKIVRRTEKRTLRINAMRQMFPRMHFNEIACEGGIKSLQHYQYGVSEKGQRTAEPLHNWASHDADSIGGYAQYCIHGTMQEKQEDEAARDPYSYDPYGSEPHPQGWMG